MACHMLQNLKPMYRRFKIILAVTVAPVDFSFHLIGYH